MRPCSSPDADAWVPTPRLGTLPVRHFRTFTRSSVGATAARRKKN